MEYFIFTCIALTVLTLFHLIRYKNSNYGKFEYYLMGEVEYVTRNVVQLWVLILVLGLVIGGIWLGGYCLGLLVGLRGL